jgi:nitrate/TMAO reductase-like tetraheme cytochrome c subunit
LVAVATVAGGFLGWTIRQQGPSPQNAVVLPAGGPSTDHLRATYDPIHFKPAIDTATDAQCLACHREVLDDTVRETSPAGVRAAASKAWYQQLSTYQGAQETFHRRHLLTPMARELMNLRCNTCHQGHDPREEAPGSSATSTPQATTDFTLRKQVDVETTCLKCHGQMNAAIMGLPAPWPESKAVFGDSCLTCHAAIRTRRHQVTYLNAAAIEAAGQQNADTCYGCHGGRAWYGMSYPYPRHAWADMPADLPDWAKNRPTQSEARFQLPASARP